MKNKLANYLATGALVVGSMLPLGCANSENLETKVSETSAVQSTDRTIQTLKNPEEIFLNNLGKEYEAYKLPNIPEPELKELKKEIKSSGLDYLRPFFDEEDFDLIKKISFVDKKNPTVKDICFVLENSVWFRLYDIWKDYKLQPLEATREFKKNVKRELGDYPLNLVPFMKQYETNPHSIKDYDSERERGYLDDFFKYLKLYEKMGLINPRNVSEREMELLSTTH